MESLGFHVVAEQLKHIGRLNTLLDISRPETVVEHCWHVSLLALLQESRAPHDVDTGRVRDLITIHEFVEVYTGDSDFFGDAAGVYEKEAAAEQQILAFLCVADRDRFGSLIDEFQAQETREAKYARALDALHPMILVAYYSPGTGLDWRDQSPARRLARKHPLLEPFPHLWEMATRLTRMAVEGGAIPSD